MKSKKGLVANLDRCMGCFACEVACKQEHQLSEGQQGIEVFTLGPFEVDGEPAMDFVPLATEHCDLCANRAGEGKQPFCVVICPTQALSVHKEDHILRLLRKNPRIHISKLSY